MRFMPHGKAKNDNPGFVFWNEEEMYIVAQLGAGSLLGCTYLTAWLKDQILRKTLASWQWPWRIGEKFRQIGGKEGKEIFGYYTVCKRCKLEQKPGMGATPEFCPANLQGASPTTPHPVVLCPPAQRPSVRCLRLLRRPHLLFHRPRPQLLLVNPQLTVGHGCSPPDTILAMCYSWCYTATGVHRSIFLVSFV